MIRIVMIYIVKFVSLISVVCVFVFEDMLCGCSRLWNRSNPTTALLRFVGERPPSISSGCSEHLAKHRRRQEVSAMQPRAVASWLECI